MKKILLLMLFVSIGHLGLGQLLMSEDFDYGSSAGDLESLSGGLWVNHSGSTELAYITSSLSMTSYPSSGVGGAASLVPSNSEDLNRSFTEQTSGIVYFSALVNISSVGSGNYFLHLNNSGFRSRIGAKDDGSGNVLFGIGASSSTLQYGTTAYSLNTTYLLVGTFNIDNGESKLYVLTAPVSTEPGTSETSDTNAGVAGTAISAVSFRQSSNIPSATIDGVRVSTNWADLMSTSAVAPITVNLSLDNSNIAENGGMAIITATLSRDTTVDITLDGLAISGTATPLVDYSASSLNPATLIITAGNTTASVTVTAIDDSADEGDETIIGTITSTSPSVQIGSSSSVTITIDNDDAPVFNSPLLFSEVADPADNFAGRFIEIYNAGGTTIDFDSETWFIVKQTNGGGTYDTYQLTGSVSAGGVFTVGNDSTAFNAAYGIFPNNADDAVVNSNGDDAYFLFKDGDHTTGTLADIYGVQDEDGTNKDWDFLDGRAVRNSSVTQGNTTWTLSEWTITKPANVSDMTPGTLNAVADISVSLSTDFATITENDGVAIVTATLSSDTTSDVTINLSLAGTATNTADYTASATSITITSGNTTGSVTITGIDDMDTEGDENVMVGISSADVQLGTITNVDITIDDDDVTLTTMTIADLRALYNPSVDTTFDQDIYIGGIVTTSSASYTGQNAIIQDATGAMLIRLNSGSHTIDRGDSVRVNLNTGRLADFNDMVQLDGVPSGNILKLTDGTLPTPEIITITQMNSDAFQAKLVTVQNVSFPAADGTIQFRDNSNVNDFTDGSETGKIRVESFGILADTLLPTGSGDLTGVLDIRSGVIRLLPQVVTDVFSNTASDVIPPTVAITSTLSGTTNQSPIPVTITFSEEVTGFVMSDITAGNGTASNFQTTDNIVFTADITPSADGTVTVDIAAGIATDLATNDNTVATQFSIIYDGTAPTVAITSTLSGTTNQSPIPVTITFSEEVTDFVMSDITAGNGTASNFQTTDNIVFTADITPTTVGLVTVDIAAGVATDLATNANTIATQFSITFDNTAPSVVITSTLSGTTNQSPIPVTITFSEEVTGFVMGDITAGNGTASNFQTTDNIVFTADITPSADGAVTVDIAAGVAEDTETNDNTAATQFSITFDGTAPSVVITSSVSNPTNVSSFSATITFSEEVTGFVMGDITVGNGVASNFQTTDNIVFTADITPSADGTVTIDIAAGIATDLATNNNTIATQFSTMYDGTAPTVAITSAVSNPTSTSPFSVTITFSEATTGFTSGDITVGNGSASNLQTSDNIVFTADITPSADGTVTVDVNSSVATDIAGNSNTAASQFSILFDAVAPTVGLSAPSSPLSASPFTLTITFSEVVTGFVASDITVGNGSASNLQTSDNTVFTADITPSADGAVTLSIAADVAQDGANQGNIASSSLTVVYDGTAPTVTVSTTAQTGSTLNPVPFTIVFSEAVSGFLASNISVVGGTAGNLQTSDNITFTVDVTVPSLGNSVSVSVPADVAQDNAGNSNTASAQASVVTDLEDDLARKGVSIFSNGNQIKLIFANAKSAKSEIAIYDLNGKLVMQKSNIDVTELSIKMPQTGMFIVKVQNQHGQLTKRVLVD